MKTLLRSAIVAALLATHGLAPVQAQAQLVWESNSYFVNDNQPIADVRSGPAHELVIAGTHRPGVPLDTFASLRIANPGGPPLSTLNWPSVPVGQHAWTAEALDAAGNIALVGYGPGGALAGLAQVSGTFVWSPVYLPAPAVRGEAVAFDANGDLLIAGRTSVGVGDVFLARYPLAGGSPQVVTWAHPAGGDDYPLSLATDAQGNAYVLGFADTLGVQRTFVLKLDAALNVLWEQERVSTQTYSHRPGLAVDPAGNAYVALDGVVGGGAPQFMLWKLDPQGATLWTRTSGAGQANHVAIDPFGRIVVAGSTGSVLVQGYDAAGTQLWSRALIGTVVPNSMSLDLAGDVLVSGTSGSNGFVQRLDRDGNLRWAYVDAVQTLRGSSGIGPGGDALVADTCSDAFGNHYLHAFRLASAAFPVCAGDGVAAACPCGNDSALRDRAGCLNSHSLAGRLDGFGMASLAGDTLALQGSSMTGMTVIYIQGPQEIAPTLFGDGLRCVGGALQRLAVRTLSGGSGQFPAAGDPSLSVAGGVSAPGLRMYQAYYRDPAPFCASQTFNATNAMRVLWIP